MIYLNDQLVEFEAYPNGETRVPKIEVGTCGTFDTVRLAWRSDADLLHLVLLRGYLRDLESEAYAAGTSKLGELPQLEIEYMPYSRMDRSENGSAFTLKYVCELINSLNFDSVLVWEPHSSVTLELLANSRMVCPAEALLPEVMEAVGFDKDRDLLVFPDAGALARYAGCWPGYHKVVLSKTRDFDTGKITGMTFDDAVAEARAQLGDDIVFDGAKAIIVDDLCSYGGTFIKAAELLRRRGVARVYLLVTHLEQSAFRGDLLRGTTVRGPLINGVFATESMMRLNEHEVGSPFVELTTGYRNPRDNTFVRLFQREEWQEWLI